jgi:ribonuclease HII
MAGQLRAGFNFSTVLRAPEPMEGATRIVGVDEAGRGSFLGPLLVGGFAVASDRVDEVRAAGARDSKELSPAQREEVYARLRLIGAMRSVTLLPPAIDRAVAHRGLNELEATAFGHLVRGLRAGEARVDACDRNERRFGRRVAHHAGVPVRVVAAHHADRDDPVVGAASIVAKVRRDRAIVRLAEQLGMEVGSGYPSDPQTVEFVRDWLAAHTERPPWLRASWATMRRVKLTRPAPTLDSYAP